jgi:hypothetical protein
VTSDSSKISWSRWRRVSSRTKWCNHTATVGEGLALLRGHAQDWQSRQPETRGIDAPRVPYGWVSFRHNGVRPINGYLARPLPGGIFPAALVIAGNKVPEKYIPNICAALALTGFVGLAPNIFKLLHGHTPFSGATLK